MNNCQKCGGSGFIYAESLLDGGQYCDCALLQLRLVNMDRIWKSLSKAKITPELAKNPPLLPYVRQNLLITASTNTFRSHFKAVCLHRSTVWDARVRTDADLLDSWLGTTKLQGKHIFDVEIAEATNLKAVDLPSLMGNFPLMVIVMGVKRLANREAANSLIEALNYRQHEELPVWLIDQPGHPVTEITHMFYSDFLAERLAEWKHVHLDGLSAEESASEPVSRPVPSVLENVLADLEHAPVLEPEPPKPKSVRKPPAEVDTSELDKLLTPPPKFKKKSRL